MAGLQPALLVAAVALSLLVDRSSRSRRRAPLPVMPPSLPPSHVVNLMTNEGSAAFGAQWRVTDVKIVEVPAAINKERYKTTYQIEPRAMATDFDDSKWELVEAKDLGARRSGGLSPSCGFARLLTMPAKLAGFDLPSRRRRCSTCWSTTTGRSGSTARCRAAAAIRPGDHPGPQHAQPRGARHRR